MIQVVLVSGAMCAPEKIQADLPTSEMWWRGPTFLSKDQQTWPKTKTDPSPEAAMEVRKKMKTSGEPVQESTLVCSDARDTFPFTAQQIFKLEKTSES